ncbi:MAG: hypothetical protein H6712_26265 [Myxococcales bacterium]|nr:hypothetical protein [Myxococcales bacterium]MCB9717380.1 hypothetical protein [Myxococcales bacterium]
MSAEQKQISLQIFTATPDSDNDETRRWVPDGDNLILKNHRGGYFTHAYVCNKDIDMSGVMSGRGKGFISFAIENGEDEVGRELVEEWRQGRIEVVFMYREWKQEEGIWENKKTVTVWGYVASASLQKGPSSIASEVHVVRVVTQNDAIGTRDYSIDCITGASTIRGGDLGARQPEPIDPGTIGTPDSSDWGAPLNG